MKTQSLLLFGAVLFGALSIALPMDVAPTRREVDGDDAIVYAWKVPEQKPKREVDGDDAIVYAWKVPDQKPKREVDGDDGIVYAWKAPETKN